MALFLINARDKADSLDLRMANRPDHLKWAAQFVERIAMAGPVFLEDGETMAGSTFVIEFETLDDAKTWAAKDPYALAGLFERVEITPFHWAIGDGKPNG